MSSREEYLTQRFEVAVLRQRIAELEAALTKAADTFEEMSSVQRALGRDVMAAACMVAERGCREVLITTNRSSKHG